MAQRNERPEYAIFREIESYVVRRYGVCLETTPFEKQRLDFAKQKHPTIMKDVTWRDYVKFCANEAREANKNKMDIPRRNHCFQAAIEAPDDYFFAPDLAMAVSYAEGHPPEGQLHLVSPQDNVLRRFWEVGLIMKKWRGWWIRTGHVLVIDVEKGRERHPWIILASEWETDEDEPRTMKPPQRAQEDDNMELGILPGDKIRTTIARLIPYQSGPESIPLLQQFGPGFHFGLQGAGKSRSETGNELPWGPDLAYILPWVAKRDGVDVCFLEGEDDPYLVYNVSTKAYSYPVANLRTLQGAADDIPPQSASVPITVRAGPSSGPSGGHGASRCTQEDSSSSTLS
ncbi:MAG: hypothetical protein Q9222_003835 [Ikaeria aurantiellina]